MGSGVEAADRLIVVNAVEDRALLLDYRNGEQSNLVVAQGLAAAQDVRLAILAPSRRCWHNCGTRSDARASGHVD
jgi:hypothetical protein